MNVLGLERLVRRGGASLAESLHFYWPTSGANEIAERNVAVHLGHAFLTAGFLAFAEAHSDGRTDTHLDSLMLDPIGNTGVFCEFKRLYNEQQAERMLSDVQRVKSFKLQGNENRHPGLRMETAFGLIAATTWASKYIAWFSSNDGTAESPGRACEEIIRVLPRDHTAWGVHVLGHGHSGGQSRTHALVYALFPLV